MRFFTGVMLWLLVTLALARALDSDPKELHECRKWNKGKWCTCRKLVKYIQDHLVGKRMGIFVPTCGRFYKKLYARKQCYMNDMECWCVHPKTGLMINGTKTEGDALNCENPPKEL